MHRPAVVSRREPALQHRKKARSNDPLPAGPQTAQRLCRRWLGQCLIRTMDWRYRCAYSCDAAEALEGSSSSPRESAWRHFDQGRQRLLWACHAMCACYIS
jgi:hypothetical protein